jgi:hypothetical protein
MVGRYGWTPRLVPDNSRFGEFNSRLEVKKFPVFWQWEFPASD